MWVGLLLRLLPYIIGAFALLGGWLYADRACWSTACKTKARQLSEVTEQLEQARQRASDLAILYAKTAEEADARVRHERESRNQQGAELHARASGLDRSPTVRLGSDARIVLNAATDFANAAPTPIRDKAPAVAVPDIAISEAQLTTFVVDAAMAYLDAKSLHQACVNFYEGLRQSAPGP